MTRLPKADRRGPGSGQARAARSARFRAGQIGILPGSRRNAVRAIVPKHDVSEARCVAVTILEAEIDILANHQRARFSSVNKAGVISAVSTIQGRQRHRISSSAAGRGVPRSGGSRARDQIRSYSRRTSSSVGCGRPVDTETSQVVETDTRPRGRSDQVSCTESTRRRATAACSTGSRARVRPRQTSAPPLRQRAGQELAFGPMQLQREGERMLALPAVVRQQRRAGGEIGQRRDVGRRSLGALARNQVELGELLALSREVISAAPRLKLVDDVEDLPPPASRKVCAPASSLPIRRCASPRVLRDQRIGRLLNAVVDEPVGARQALDQFLSDGRP